MLLTIIQALKALRNYHRTMDELSQLSDRDLADIGLTRSDIESVAAGTFAR